MNGGDQAESLYTLTGMPTVSYTLNKVSTPDLWNSLVDFEAKNYIMTASVVDRQDGKDKKGLVDNHAYTILGAKVYNGEKLVHIRNPWGKENYTGEWSDKDVSKWTSAAKSALDH
jgi:hypothetical protein